MNWINRQNSNEPTTLDKVRELLKYSYKLVLVQQHELERIRQASTLHTNQINYVDSLYKHYIVEKQPKTYLI